MYQISLGSIKYAKGLLNSYIKRFLTKKDGGNQQTELVAILLQNKPINVLDKIIHVNGKVFYNDRRQRIDLKKPITDLIEQETANIFYRMELCFNPAKAIKRINELSEQNVIPILLYFEGRK